MNRRRRPPRSEVVRLVEMRGGDHRVAEPDARQYRSGSAVSRFSCANPAAIGDERALHRDRGRVLQRRVLGEPPEDRGDRLLVAREIEAAEILVVEDAPLALGGVRITSTSCRYRTPRGSRTRRREPHRLSHRGPVLTNPLSTAGGSGRQSRAGTWRRRRHATRRFPARPRSCNARAPSAAETIAVRRGGALPPAGRSLEKREHQRQRGVSARGRCATRGGAQRTTQSPLKPTVRLGSAGEIAPYSPARAAPARAARGLRQLDDGNPRVRMQPIGCRDPGSCRHPRKNGCGG